MVKGVMKDEPLKLPIQARVNGTVGKNPEMGLRADNVSCRDGTLFFDLDKFELISFSIRL